MRSNQLSYAPGGQRSISVAVAGDQFSGPCTRVPGQTVRRAAILFLDDRNAFDFNQRSHGEFGYLDGRARWRVVAKVLGVDGVERREVVQVGEEAGRLHHIREPSAGSREDSSQILYYLLGLNGDVAFDKFHRRRVKGYLTGGKQEIA